MVAELAVLQACIALLPPMMRLLLVALPVSYSFNLLGKKADQPLQIPPAVVLSRVLQSVQTQVGRYGKAFKATSSAVKLDWSVSMTITLL